MCASTWRVFHEYCSVSQKGKFFKGKFINFVYSWIVLYMANNKCSCLMYSRLCQGRFSILGAIFMFQKVSKFIKHHIRGKWTHEVVCAAMRDVEMYKTPERKAGTSNGVPRETLRRYLKKSQRFSDLIKRRNYRRTYHGYRIQIVWPKRD